MTVNCSPLELPLPDVRIAAKQNVMFKLTVAGC